MHSLKLPINNIDYPVVEYYGGRNLNITFGVNNERMIQYSLSTNWLLDNQNPLVSFLKNLSLDINQSNEYLYNAIASKSYTIASLCKLTSIYSKGKSFNKILFPEPKHETILVIPFGKSIHDINYYFNTDLKLLNPLTTIYTTDNRIRYSTTRLTDNINSNKIDFTVVQVDPYALAIGYIRYCKDKINSNDLSTLTPNFYLSTLPLANFYKQHNNYVLLNLLNNKNFEVDGTKWNQVDIKQNLNNYLDFQNYTLSKLSLKSITQYIQQLNALPDQFKTYLNLNPINGFSSSFIQLSWVYNFAPMQISINYLNLINSINLTDDGLHSYLRKYLNYNVNTLTNNIPDVSWNMEYRRLFNELKSLV